MLSEWERLGEDLFIQTGSVCHIYTKTLFCICMICIHISSHKRMGKLTVLHILLLLSLASWLLHMHVVLVFMSWMLRKLRLTEMLNFFFYDDDIYISPMTKLSLCVTTPCHNTDLWLVQTDHVTTILYRDWLLPSHPHKVSSFCVITLNFLLIRVFVKYRSSIC